MSINISVIDCDVLDSRTNLAAYIAAVRDETHGDLAMASMCEKEICNALWGSGNPDVDGIGVRS